MERTLESIILDASETEAVLRSTARSVPFRLTRLRDGDLVLSSTASGFPDGWSNSTIRAGEDGVTVDVCGGESVAVKPKGAVFKGNVLTIECDGPAVEILYSEGERGLCKLDADGVDALWKAMMNGMMDGIATLARKAGADSREPYVSCGLNFIANRIECGVCIPVNSRRITIGERAVEFETGSVSVTPEAVLVEDGRDVWELIFATVGKNAVSEAAAALSPLNGN